MLRIETHIKRLLLVHDCVIVPKFGGFVLQAVPAMQMKEHIFRPFQKEISFNVTLQHNDGLLLESYMQMYAVDSRQAGLMLEEDVMDMKNVLLQHKEFSMDELGTFTIGEEGQMIFQSNETELFSISSYGLPTFHFPVLELSQVEQKGVTFITPIEKKKDVYYIPISRRLIRTAVASAAAIALFLLVSTPVKDIRQEAYTASFIPTEVIAQKSVIEEHVLTKAQVQDSSVKDEPAEELITREVKKVLPKELTSKKQSQPITKKQTTESTKVKSVPKMYHIVIASFPSEKQADEYLMGVDRTVCKHVSKVVRDGKYRIYADKFDNRKEAEAYMTNLRANPKYKDAWLYICR